MPIVLAPVTVMEGSTQDHIVRHAPCSVLVVRGGDASDDDSYPLDGCC